MRILISVAAAATVRAQPRITVELAQPRIYEGESVLYLVTIENTHNRGAGRIQPYEAVVEICGWAREHGLRIHLDAVGRVTCVEVAESTTRCRNLETACLEQAHRRLKKRLQICSSTGRGAREP